MKQMWSPWRSRYLHEFHKDHRPKGDQDSVFSQMAAEQRDEANFIIWRGNEVFVVLNQYPYNSGHLLILPFREVEAYEELTTSEQVEIASTIEQCIHWLKAAFNPDGFNVGMNLGRAAGAGIPEHLHVHVVPRWDGDTNFMPTLSETKVLPEALEETYERLRNVIDD